MLYSSRLLIPLFLVLCAESESAKILFYLGVSTYSHRILISPLAERLADRGDQVTFFCPHPPKKSYPNVTEFLPKIIREVGREAGGSGFLNRRLREGRLGSMRSASTLYGRGISFCRLLLEAPETQNLINTATFDLIIIDSLFNECGFGLAHKFGAKTIIFSTSTVLSWWYDTFGFLPETSWVSSEIFVAFSYPLNFAERILSTLLPILLHAYRQLYYYPALEEVFRTNLDVTAMPPLAELVANTSLILLNSHFSEEEARSIPPFVIPVAGLHLQEPTKEDIPSDALKFIEAGGKDGFIYVSFGSGVKISESPAKIRAIFFTAFKNSNARFIWKWEGPRPEEMPSNIFTAEWLPQQQILAMEPRVFITHGGALSIQEATAFQVPVIVFPIFGDQDYTAFRVARTGRGIVLEISTLTLDILESALHEILTKTAYKENMIRAGNLFRDRPRSPMEESLWWVDYVLRSNDTSHLRPLGRHQYWFQRRALDVWFFTFVILVGIKVIVVSLLKQFVYYFINLSQKLRIYASLQRVKLE